MDVGIIGGTDGPTATLVSGDPAGLVRMLLAAVVILGAAIWFFLRKRKK